MIAGTVGSVPRPPLRRVAARAAAHRSPAMCKRKARMRGGGEGGRKCAFGGANFSKDGKAHNLCDAAKGAGCHLFARCRCCKAAGGNPLWVCLACWANSHRRLFTLPSPESKYRWGTRGTNSACESDGDDSDGQGAPPGGGGVQGTPISARAAEIYRG